MAPSTRGLIGWSWWPLRWPTYALIFSLVLFLALDLLVLGVASHKNSLSMFIALVIAAPYVVIFIIGFPHKPSYEHLTRRKPPK